MEQPLLDTYRPIDQTLIEKGFTSSRSTTPKGFVVHQFTLPTSRRQVAIILRKDEDLQRIRVEDITLEAETSALVIDALNIGDENNVVLSIKDLSIGHYGGILVLGPRPLTLDSLTMRFHGTLVHTYSADPADNLLSLHIERAILSNSAFIPADNKPSLLELIDSQIENAIIPVLSDTTIHNSHLLAHDPQSLICRGNLLNRHAIIPAETLDAPTAMILDSSMTHGMIPYRDEKDGTFENMSFGQLVDTEGRSYVSMVFKPGTSATEDHLTVLDGSEPRRNALTRFIAATAVDYEYIKTMIDDYEQEMIDKTLDEFRPISSVKAEYDEIDLIHHSTALDLSFLLEHMK